MAYSPPIALQASLPVVVLALQFLDCGFHAPPFQATFGRICTIGYGVEYDFQLGLSILHMTYECPQRRMANADSLIPTIVIA